MCDTFHKRRFRREHGLGLLAYKYEKGDLEQYRKDIYVKRLLAYLTENKALYILSTA